MLRDSVRTDGSARHVAATGDHVVDDAVLAGFLGREPAVALGVGGDLFDRLTGVLGEEFLDPSTAVVYPIAGAGAQSLGFTAPNDPVFLGLTGVFQVYDPATVQLTNPVYATIVD